MKLWLTMNIMDREVDYERKTEFFLLLIYSSSIKF